MGKKHAEVWDESESAAVAEQVAHDEARAEAVPDVPGPQPDGSYVVQVSVVEAEEPKKPLTPADRLHYAQRVVRGLSSLPVNVQANVLRVVGDDVALAEPIRKMLVVLRTLNDADRAAVVRSAIALVGSVTPDAPEAVG